jgi:hypothetical protein
VIEGRFVGAGKSRVSKFGYGSRSFLRIARKTRPFRAGMQRCSGWEACSSRFHHRIQVEPAPVAAMPWASKACFGYFTAS